MAQQVLEQAFPVPPPAQEIRVAAPQAPLPPPIEMPEGDDIHEILRQLKGKKLPPEAIPMIQSSPEVAKAVVAAYAPPPAPVEDLAEQLRLSVEAATPKWLAEAQEDIRRDFPVKVEIATPDPQEHGKLVIEEGEIDHEDLNPDRLPYPDEPVFSFLGGTAGTGKTYTSIQRVEQYDDAKLVATTGIAAVNLGGTTINSLLQYGDTHGLRANYEIGKLGAILRRLTLSGYHRLIVDEVSMMDGHQLDILVTAIEELNVWNADQGKRLFGMTLVGDFAQLPPVNAPFVFQRPSWGRFEPNITLLTEPRRQADHDFIRALQAVRRGDRAAAMSYFGPMITQGSEEKFDGSTILSTNAEVDRYNKLRMMDITAPADWYTADRVGEQLTEWQKQIPDRLEMKPGALVMILANKTVEGTMLYANGDLGHYAKKHNETTSEVQLLRNGMTVLVQSVLKEKGVATGHTGKKLAREEVKGSIRYMPLRIAYATTCHKSQGLSLDRVQIMFHNRFWASPGMLYVALSRARTPQGLRLVGTPSQFEARINTNPDIRRWL